jgi:hypothetical protein
MLIQAQIVIGPVLISAIAVIVLKLVVSSVVLVLGIEFYFTFVISCMKPFFIAVFIASLITCCTLSLDYHCFCANLVKSLGTSFHPCSII